MEIENKGVVPAGKTPDELTAEIAKLQQDKESLVGETTELRRSRADKETEITSLKELLKQATEKNNSNPEEERIATIVAKTLAIKESERAISNRKAAFDRFVDSHKEYHPDNDPGGLKRAALERELTELNSWKVGVEVDDLVKSIGKADAYLRGHDTTRHTETPATPYSSTPSTPPASPGRKDAKVSETEQKLIDRNGWTEEHFLSIKAKMPDFVDSLLAGVR